MKTPRRSGGALEPPVACQGLQSALPQSSPVSQALAAAGRGKSEAQLVDHEAGDIHHGLDVVGSARRESPGRSIR